MFYKIFLQSYEYVLIILFIIKKCSKSNVTKQSSHNDLVVATQERAVRASTEFTSEKIWRPVARPVAWNRKCNVIVRHPPRDKSRRRRREKTRVRPWIVGPRQCHWNSIGNLQGVSRCINHTGTRKSLY